VLEADLRLLDGGDAFRQGVHRQPDADEIGRRLVAELALVTDPVHRRDGAHRLAKAGLFQLAGQPGRFQRDLVAPAQEQPQLLRHYAEPFLRPDDFLVHASKVAHKCSSHNDHLC
jgi:hypothetical protein